MLIKEVISSSGPLPGPSVPSGGLPLGDVGVPLAGQITDRFCSDVLDNVPDSFRKNTKQRNDFQKNAVLPSRGLSHTLRIYDKEHRRRSGGSRWNITLTTKGRKLSLVYMENTCQSTKIL